MLEGVIDMTDFTIGDDIELIGHTFRIDSMIHRWEPLGYTDRETPYVIISMDCAPDCCTPPNNIKIQIRETVLQDLIRSRKAKYIPYKPNQGANVVVSNIGSNGKGKLSSGQKYALARITQHVISVRLKELINAQSFIRTSLDLAEELKNKRVEAHLLKTKKLVSDAMTELDDLSEILPNNEEFQLWLKLK